MIIQSTLKVAKVNPGSQRALQALAEGEDDIAWSEDSDPEHSLSGAQRVTSLPELPNYRAASLEEVAAKSDPAKAKQLRKAYISLATNSTSLVGHYFPEALDQPIQGMELLVASYNAIDAWADSSRKNNVQPTLATAKAVLESIDVFSPYFPVLQQIQPYTKVAGVVLKTAESAYLVYSAHQE